MFLGIWVKRNGRMHTDRPGFQYFTYDFLDGCETGENGIIKKERTNRFSTGRQVMSGFAEWIFIPVGKRKNREKNTNKPRSKALA